VTNPSSSRCDAAAVSLGRLARSRAIHRQMYHAATSETAVKRERVPGVTPTTKTPQVGMRRCETGRAPGDQIGDQLGGGPESVKPRSGTERI